MYLEPAILIEFQMVRTTKMVHGTRFICSMSNSNHILKVNYIFVMLAFKHNKSIKCHINFFLFTSSFPPVQIVTYAVVVVLTWTSFSNTIHVYRHTSAKPIITFIISQIIFWGFIVLKLNVNQNVESHNMTTLNITLKS